MKDPRIPMLTVTQVTVTPDLGVARIRYIPLFQTGDLKEIQDGLNHVARYLRGPVGRSLGIRHAPELRFELDKNVEHASRIDAVLASLPKAAEPAAPTEPAVDAGEE